MKYIKNFLQDIAAAIREKTNKTDEIKTEDFPKAINSIVSTTEAGKYQEKNVELTTPYTTAIIADDGYDGITKVTVKPKLQEKTAENTSPNGITVYPDDGYCGLGKVTISHKLQTKSVELTSTSSTTVTPDSGYAAIGSLSITPKLQDKTVTITSNKTTTVTPDSGYCGLKSVKATSNVGSSNLTYSVLWCNGASSKSGSVTIPAAVTRAYLIVHASTQNDFAGCSVSGTGLTITRTNSNDLGDPASAVNGGFRYSVFVYLITKSAGTARTLSVTWNGNAIRHSCPVLIY